jgi:lactate permease
LVCGGSFALVQFLVANLHGPRLVDVAGGLASLISLALLLRVWQPRTTWHFADERPPPAEPAAPPAGAAAPVSYPPRQLVSAWVPWVLLTLFVFVWGLPETKDLLGTTSVAVPVPGLHQVVARDLPVVRERKVEDAVYRFDWLSTTGTSIFLAAVVSAAWLRVSPRHFVALFLATCYRMRWPLATIACMLAIAFTSRYSGMDATLGLAFTRTGAVYPLFAALLGWLGVALTGSDTSSNALFGSLQTITADQLTVPGAALEHLSGEQARILLASANSTGGVMGKMIDAQSIVVAAAATGQPGQEGPILRFVFLHSLILAVLMGLLVLVQAYGWSSIIPVEIP